MGADREAPEVRLPLTPEVFHILLALADGERHGYSIMQEIVAQTDGKLRIGPTTLYRSIKRMLEDGLIEEMEERPDPALDDERRRYYRLTELGLQVARAEVQRLAQAVEVARQKPLLGDAVLKPMFGGA
ncbi:PadR family transcriptional regulator [Dictyobacter aurantiacus]|uniref:PadR family transcriptional regulator n=1 Tax=Dictyobacter aurantiacus TaxID=1936993 RepID=A0A401ZKB1_9CHLR|nr:PadR family transcriptional regulator [Dictyobacter aurantiacus]GCE07301.1 PadR family transcriptional regulator [Dictyobacter aurantiacus]